MQKELDDKLTQVHVLIAHVKNLETTAGNVKLIPSIKASIILCMYNILESTVSDLLIDLHDRLIDVDYVRYSDSIKKIYEEYFKKNKNISFEEVFEAGVKFPEFKDFSQLIQPYSGNLDFRKIKEVFKKYGFKVSQELTSNTYESIQKIKNFRNKLAHGEILFASCGQFTSREIEELFECLKIVLSALIKDYEKFLQLRGYEYIAKNQNT